MPQDRTPQLSFNLSRRLISIFLVSVLAVYTAGITVTLRLRRSAMQDWQAAYTAQAADFTDQLNTELLRIRTQMKYTLTRSVTLRLTLTPRQASFPALYDSILRMTEQVYTMQNTSSLIQSTTAYFPSLNKTIHSSGTYNDPTALEQQLIEAYYAAPGHSAVLTVGGRLYLVSDATSFNNKTSTALVWAELSTAALTRLCSQYAENGQTTAIYCTDGSNIFTVRSPGSASAPAALVVDIQDAVLNEFTGSTETKVDAAEYLRIVQPVGSWSLWTASYAGTDALREVTASFAVWIGVQTIIMLLAVGIFLFLVWRLITKPFRQIAKQLQTMEQTGMLLPDPNGGPAISNDMDFLHYAFASWAASCRPRWNRHIIIKSSLISPRSNTYRRRSIRTFCTIAFTIVPNGQNGGHRRHCRDEPEIKLLLPLYYPQRPAGCYPGDGVPEHCGLYRDTDHPLW